MLFLDNLSVTTLKISYMYFFFLQTRRTEINIIASTVQHNTPLVFADQLSALLKDSHTSVFSHKDSKQCVISKMESFSRCQKEPLHTSHRGHK